MVHVIVAIMNKVTDVSKKKNTGNDNYVGSRVCLSEMNQINTHTVASYLSPSLHGCNVRFYCSNCSILRGAANNATSSASYPTVEV